MGIGDDGVGSRCFGDGEIPGRDSFLPIRDNNTALNGMEKALRNASVTLLER